MPTPFAQLQDSINRTVLGTLSNAVAVVGGRDVPVIFDQTYDAPFDTQVDAALTDCVGSAALLAGVERGSAITVGGAAFNVERVEPDGTGLTRLVLRPAP